MAKTKETLTNVEKFYIENNPDLSIEKLSKDLGKSVDVITEFCESLMDKKNKGKTKNLMNKHGKKSGVVSMTQAASIEADSNTGYLTLDQINQALIDGDTARAVMLKKKYEEQQVANRNIIKAKYEDKIHYIDKPDDDAEVY